MEDKRSSRHRRTSSSPRSSWGDGIKLTKEIFENCIPYSDAKARTVENVSKAFHENNQKFLKGAQATNKHSAADILLSQFMISPPSRPPRPTPWGNSAGRGALKPIGDDDWSEDIDPEEGVTRSSALKTPILGIENCSIKNEKMPKSSESMPEYSSSSDSELLESSTQASGEYSDYSRFTPTGYSGDDNRSLTSSEFSFKGTLDREMVDPPFTKNLQKSCLYQQKQGDDSTEGGEEKKKQREKHRRKEREKKHIRKFFQELEGEHQTLLQQWREEFKKEQRQSNEASGYFDVLGEKVWKFLSYAEVFISNMPLTIGAVGLSWVTQGTIWFKFMEENIDTCTTVHFYSPHCIYPEFPGCFDCDMSNPIYLIAVTFHYFCHCVAAICCLLFLTKCLIAWRVVADELSNPTTSTPCGVVCITLICVAAGRGIIGEVVVLVTSAFHFMLSIWFLYMAIFKYHLWPDPGWFPNTVGIAYAAVKTWLYFPVPGLIFMVFCMAYLFSTFFIAVYRAWWNHKIAAPVCFISLSAPSITMYAMTIMAQPSPQREAMLEASPELETRFDEMHREIYLPVQHCMMVLSLLGLISALHCLYTRWPEFQKKEFSPAHVAFIFPLLSHTNAVQAYRSGVDAFSNIPVKSPFKVTLFTYWLSCLIIGTILNFIFTYKYIVRLPKWTTNVDIVFWETEGQPPSSPCHTIVHEMLTKENGGAAVHECCFNQTFTNPAVLQANEAGALVRVRRGTEDYANYGPYARTRHVASHGFDLTLTEAEFRRERAELLDWVAKNAPRTRNRTMSIPQCFKLGSSGCEDATTSSSSSSTRSAYGTFPTQDQQPPAETKEEDPQGVQHKRSSTWGGWV